MPFRRRSRKTTKSSRARSAFYESLESRTMLTAVVNGLFTGTNTIYDGQPFFIYRQANGNANVKISITGNVTAEFIGARPELVTDVIPIGDTDQMVLTDLLPDTAAAFVAATGANASTFLYSIYIVSADVNSAISIAVVPTRPVPPAAPIDRPMQPFGGGVPMRITNASTGASELLTTANGGVYIGAQTSNDLDVATDESIPLIGSQVTSFGMRPSTDGSILAGIHSAPGVNIGKILIGGTVTGTVNLPANSQGQGGNIDTFYAGDILTGDAAGVAFGVSQEDQVVNNLIYYRKNNFSIGGDVHNLLVGGSFGTTSLGTVETAGDLFTPTYMTGFQLHTGGRVGFMFADDSFSGQAVIRNLPGLTGTGTLQREIEYIAPALTGDATLFDPFFRGLDATIGAATMDARFINDTYDTAQYLGTFRSQQLNDANAILLRGSLTNEAGAEDYVDFYGISLLAGQVIDVTLDDSLGDLNTAGHARLGILDPRGRLIATDYTNTGGQFSRVNKTIRIKAAIPGTYRIVAAREGDLNFNGTFEAGVEFNRTFTNVVPYELKITNAGNLGLGALVTNLHIGTIDIGSLGIQVLSGDVGTIRAGMGANLDGRATGQGSGQIISLSDPWYVPGGHYRSMEAFSIGHSGATIVYLGSGPDLLIRKGSIGLLRSSGASLTDTLMVNDTHFTIEDNSPLFPTSEDDLSLMNARLAVGMDIQVVDCAGVFEGGLFANRGIGVLRTQQLGGITLTGGPISQLPNETGTDPVLMVNVDTRGSDGIIDLVDVTLNTAGTSSVYHPVLWTGPNGNVRYFHVGNQATIRWDRQFGGGTVAAPRQYAPGEQVQVFDDSGARVVLTPTPRVRNTLFPRPVSALSDYLDPPSLALLTLPVRGKSGSVILRVDISQVNDPFSDGATDINRPGGGGMHVQASAGNGQLSAAEIGEINLTLTPAAATSNPMTFNPFTSATGGITADVLAAARSYVRTAPPDDPTLVIRPLDLIFEGNVPVDIYEIVGTAAQVINSINNQTTGEILNVSGGQATVGPDIFDFTALNIGVGKSHTGALVEGGVQRVVDTFPFTDVRNLINVSDVASIRARGAIGNVQATNIGTISADSDNRNTTGTLEGIVGPIAARGTANQLIGNIVLVDVGEGIATSGTGGTIAAAGAGAGAVRGFINAGIFADGIIDAIVGNGDIRGDIVATANTTFVQQQATDAAGNALLNPDGTPLNINTPRFAIGSIRLTNGSIIGADILATPLPQSVEGYASGSVQYSFTQRTFIPAETQSNPDFDFGSIRLDGTGGMLGSFVLAPDIGQITASGFGVISSNISTFGFGVIQGINAGGLGIRNVQINTGDIINTQSGGSVRSLIASGNGARVPTTAYTASVRQSEQARFDVFTGLSLDEFNDLHQYLGTSTRRPTIVGRSETGLIEDTQAAGPGDLGSVKAFRIIGRDVITTDANGRRTRIAFGSSAYPMRFNFANSVGSVSVTDVVDGLALITNKLKNFSAGNDVIYTAINVGTSVENFYAGAFRGTSSLKMTTGSGVLQNFRTKRSLYGQVVVSQDILNMTVGTDIGSPLIYASRNIKNLNVKGSLLTGTSITARRVLSNLVIGGDIQQGATVRAGSIGKQKIGGQILGDIIII